MKSGRPEPLPCNQRSLVRVIARPFPPGDGSPSVNSVQAGSRCKGRRPCVGRRRAAASLLWDCACGVCVGVTQTFRALADEPGPTMSSTGGSVKVSVEMARSVHASPVPCGQLASRLSAGLWHTRVWFEYGSTSKKRPPLAYKSMVYHL